MFVTDQPNVRDGRREHKWSEQDTEALGLPGGPMLRICCPWRRVAQQVHQYHIAIVQLQPEHSNASSCT